MKIYVVGLGPGAEDLLAPRAKDVIAQCDIIAGYTTYLKQFPELFAGKEIICNGMRGELERCKLALDATLEGKSVVVISSGDAGIYGMAGLLLELSEEEKYAGIEVESVPGITAASAAAAILGAPLMNDFCVLSLSNLMTPEPVIIKRLKAAASADLVTVLYNPASVKRRQLIVEAINIFSACLPPETPVGIVRNACREDERHDISSLGAFPFDIIDMFTLVLIGNSNTVVKNNRMYTRRGYIDKYGR